MPLYVGTSQKRRRVKLLTAGDTIYKLSNELGGTVDLRAVVNDITNLRNHTLSWKQTKGNEVQLSSKNTLETSYTITDKTDKTFYFYLDEGMNTQQEKKVEIYYTPTSTDTAIRGTYFKHTDNHLTIPNFRFEHGAEFPAPEGKFNPDVNILVGTGIAFDDISNHFLEGKALRVRLYGEVGKWTHEPTTLLREEEAIDKKLKKFFFVYDGSYAVEVDYIHSNHSGVVTYRSETIFAFDAGASEDLYRGIDEVLPCGTGTKVDLINLKRNRSLRDSVQSTGGFVGSCSQEYLGLFRSKPSNAVFINPDGSLSDKEVEGSSPIGSGGHLVGGTSFKFLSITRLDPSQIGNS